VLMSVVQVGGDTVRTYGADVAAVLEAAVGMPQALDSALRS
jgi:hypothetical protein